jgi:hypothetical protein
MNLHKGQSISIKKPASFMTAGYVEAELPRKHSKPDLEIGESFYSYTLGEGEGNKYVKRKWRVVGETDYLYICEHRGKYATTRECFRKDDYRLGLGMEKAN